MGATATPVGREPVANGEPGTAVSMPKLVFTENTESELAFWLLTKRRLWTESKAMNSAPAPAGNGEPETGVKAPDVLILNTEIVPDPELDTNARLCVEAWFIMPLLLLMLPQPLAANKSMKLASNGRMTETIGSMMWRKPGRNNIVEVNMHKTPI